MDRAEISKLLNVPLGEQKVQVEQKVVECIQILSNKLNKPLRLPEVDYDLTGTTAGQAWGATRIRINTALLHTDWDEMLNDTVPHEVAHCVVDQVWPHARTRSHGYEWQMVMRMLGLEPTRCHNMKVEKVRKHPRKYIYECNCGEKLLTKTRHNKLQRGFIYVCEDCRAQITLLNFKGEKTGE